MSSEHANKHYGRGSSANAVHFYQLIQPHQLQDEELKIRRSFVEGKYWDGVSNPISLKLPNGSVWKMFWEKRGDDVWLLNKNWKIFARSLRSGDQLVFKYNGESHFDVIIFDDSALEIDYSNIRSSNNDDVEEEDNTQQVEEQVEKESGDDDECVEIISESQKPSKQPVKEEEIKSCGEHESCKRKINMMDSDADADATSQNVSGANNNSNSEDVVDKKKAKKFSTTKDFKERAWNSHSDHENPNFTLKLSRTYAEGDKLRIPTRFSKKYKKELEGAAATINCLGEDKTWKVNLKLDAVIGNFVIYATGWKSFSQEYNLQVGDVCKFEMTKRKPVAFVITITKARDEPRREPLQGSEHEPNQQHQEKSEKLPVDKSRSCKKTTGSADSDKQNRFMVYVSSLLKLSVPTEFIKRYKICSGNTLELKVGEQSWLVKARYLPQLDFWRFSEGWLEFVSGSNLKIGDNCLFEKIDEENLVFKVSIVLDV